MLSRDERIKTVVERAMEKGTDINSQNNLGQTPLMLAIKNFITAKDGDEQQIDMSVIKFILDKNPDLDIQDQNKQTAFHLVCRSASVPLLELILSKNPNVLIRDKLDKRAVDYFRTDEMKKVYQKYVMG